MANETILVGADGSALTIAAATVVLSIALFSCVWAIHVKKEDAGVVDFFWGPAAVSIGALAVVLAAPPAPTTLLALALAGLWAVRLTIHMVWRHQYMTGEDARYREMRLRGGPAYWWKSLFTVFWVQALVNWLVAGPLVVLALRPQPEPDVPILVAGALAFAVGLAIETVADRQLWSFKARPENRGRLMTTGLFAWSRHPNYFGETLLWWGLGVVAFAGTGSLLALVGPAVLTVLLIKVSGVDLLDARLAATRPEYGAWAARTSAFLPLPPRGPVTRRTEPAE